VEIRIYYEDTDCGQVVYYANYLRYFERARTEFLRHLGVDVGHWMSQGLLFTVSHAEVDYHAPARYGDLLDVDTSVTEVRKVRFSLAHEIQRRDDGRRLVTGMTSLACVGPDGRPARIPEAVLEVLEGAREPAPRGPNPGGA
jgi:acyl-CoA thioester hydrolase